MLVGKPSAWVEWIRSPIVTLVLIYFFRGGWKPFLAARISSAWCLKLKKSEFSSPYLFWKYLHRHLLCWQRRSGLGWCSPCPVHYTQWLISQQCFHHGEVARPLKYLGSVKENLNHYYMLLAKKVRKSQKHFFLKLHCPQKRMNI